MSRDRRITLNQAAFEQLKQMEKRDGVSPSVRANALLLSTLFGQIQSDLSPTVGSNQDPYNVPNSNDDW